MMLYDAPFTNRASKNIINQRESTATFVAYCNNRLVTTKATEAAETRRHLVAWRRNILQYVRPYIKEDYKRKTTGLGRRRRLGVGPSVARPEQTG